MKTYGGLSVREWREAWESFGPDSGEGIALQEALDYILELETLVEALEYDLSCSQYTYLT
jgi:hypothetical protein